MTEHEHKHEHDRREGDPLTAALRALREADDEARGASMDVEARLLTEVRAIAWARRRRRYVATTMASAAAVLVAGAIAFAVWRAVMTPETPAGTLATTTAGTTSGAATATGEIATAFIPLAYSSVPASEQYLVRMEVPRAALASFGLGAIESTARSSSKDTVLADVLVGQDGLARAVRFVRPSDGRGQTQSQPQTRTQ